MELLLWFVFVCGGGLEEEHVRCWVRVVALDDFEGHQCKASLVRKLIVKSSTPVSDIILVDE